MRNTRLRMAFTAATAVLLLATGCSEDKNETSETSTAPASAPASPSSTASSGVGTASGGAPSAGAAQSGDAAFATAPMKELTTVKMSVEAGPNPETLGRFKEQIKKELNIDLQFATYPFPDAYPVQYLDLTQGHQYDILSIWPTYMGDYGPFLAKLGDIAPGGHDQAWADMQMEDVHPGYHWVGYHDNDFKAVQYDGDVKLLFIRSDLFNKAEEKAAYKAKYNGELGCPSTWDEYLNMAEFFNRPDQKLAGTAEIAGFLSYFTFVDHYMGMGGHFFNPSDMKPFPDRELAVKATESMVAAFKRGGGPTATSNTIGSIIDAMLKDESTAMNVMWPEIWKRSGDPKASNGGKELVTTCVMPGGIPDQAGGRVMTIAKDSKVKEAAYKVLSFFARKEVTANLVNDNTTALDPWRKSHLQPEVYKDLCKSDAARCQNYVDAINTTIDKGYPVLNIPGTGRYHEIVERHATAAITGEESAKDAVDKMAEEMDAVTEQLGRDRQSKSYTTYVEKFLAPKGLAPKS